VKTDHGQIKQIKDKENRWRTNKTGKGQIKLMKNKENVSWLKKTGENLVLFNSSYNKDCFLLRQQHILSAPGTRNCTHFAILKPFQPKITLHLCNILQTVYYWPNFFFKSSQHDNFYHDSVMKFLETNNLLISTDILT